ncbi:MAG TPA: type II secretion system protein GspJ [Polyangiaceae bacterium]|jgi:general secretion pathway protein J|nr:type II secretion system protein GspJ [Polyangiaceae bacterium]
MRRRRGTRHGRHGRVRARTRGMTLIEVVVAIGILAMVAVLVHGVIDSLSRGKKAEALRSERVHEGREAVARFLRDVSAAYLSLHVPAVTALITSRTAFVGQSSTPYDRLDFTAFAHKRTERDSHESDQAEVGYFVAADPDVPEKMDLVRREQTPIDYDPLKGGIRNVVAENVTEFDVRYLDPLTDQWVDTWDSMQQTGQPNRLPLAVSVRLVLKGIGDGVDYTYMSKQFLPIQDPLSFGIPRQ